MRAILKLITIRKRRVCPYRRPGDRCDLWYNCSNGSIVAPARILTIGLADDGRGRLARANAQRLQFGSIGIGGDGFAIVRCGVARKLRLLNSDFMMRAKTGSKRGNHDRRGRKHNEQRLPGPGTDLHVAY